MDIENQQTQIILTSVAIFLFFIIIVIVYRTSRNKRCNRNNNRNDNRNDNRNKEKYEESREASFPGGKEVNIKTNQDQEFLNKNVYQNTGLGIKDYEYLVNYPNGKSTLGEWSWGSSQNGISDCNYSKTSEGNKNVNERTINNLFKF